MEEAGRAKPAPPTLPVRSPGPVPAATLVVLRGGGGAREVLLLRRPPGSSFAPDVWVFPGGRVDGSDYELDHARLAAGPSPREWASVLAVEDPGEAGAYVVAALRETWEETGILLTVPGVDQASCEAARGNLLAGTRALERILEERGVRLATKRLRYIARWITPDWLPRRFDTRFFLCNVPPRTRCVLRGEELVDQRWLSPGEALRCAEAGEIQLLPPTVDTLRRLSDGEL